MTWRLMKLDPAWMWLPVVGIAALCICVLGGNLAFWNLLLIAGAIAADRQPDTGLHMALPVTVRPILVARTLSVLGLIWLPLAICGYFLVARRDSDVSAGTVLAFGSVITLVSVWTNTTRIQGRAGPPWFAMFSFTIFVAYTLARSLLSDVFWRWGGWIFQESTSVAAPTTAVCLFLSGAIFLKGFFTAADSYLVEPSEASIPVPSVPVPSHGTMGVNPVVRIAFSLSYFWILFFLSAILTGLRLGDTTVFTFIFLFSAWSSVRPKVRWMASLPVSPRAILAVILLPALAAVGGGYILAVHVPVARITWLKTSRDSGITLPGAAGCARLNVVPPLEFLLPAVTGKAPLIQAPWGETFQQKTQWVDGVEVYNPWAVGCNNSERFLDWQLSRASVVVYGKQVARDQLADTHSVLTPLAVPGPRAQIFGILSLAAALMLITLFSISEDWYRLRPRWLRFLAIIPCSLLFVGQNFLARWASWTLSENLPLAIAIAVVPLALIYWATDAMFRRLEFVDKPVAGERP